MTQSLFAGRAPDLRPATERLIFHCRTPSLDQVYHLCAFERAHAGGGASALRGDLPEGRSLCGALSPEDALSFEYADDLKHWYTPPEGFVASNLEGRATTFARDKALKSLA